MRRGTTIWIILTACALLITGAMGWFTRKVRELEHERALAEARADLEERTRLALWRMDAVGATLVLAENNRPPADYRPAPPSPLLGADDPLVLLHFSLGRDNQIRSPEAPDAAPEAPPAAPAGWLAERRSRLARLAGLLAGAGVAGDTWRTVERAAALGETAWAAVPKAAPAEQQLNLDLRQQQDAGQVRREVAYQQSFNALERAQRAKVVDEAVASNTSLLESRQQAKAAQIEAVAPAGGLPPAPAGQPPAATPQRGAAAAAANPTAPEPPTPGPVTPAPASGLAWSRVLPLPAETILELGTMRPVWIGDELFLLRRLTVQLPDGRADNRIQGAWLAAAAVQARLLGEAADLLDRARLVPVHGAATLTGAAHDDPLALVSFPFRLDPGEAAAAAPGSALSAPLLVGWLAVLCALGAAALLVAGVMRLSERRAAFVSSVTHELRTPLTTFRLYSDLLAEGMVPQEKRPGYLRTMRTEADRLHHLVENVLAYSRIERGSARTRRERVAAADLLERLRPRLEERAAGDAMQVAVRCSDACRAAVLHTDVTAVEQIIFNLVDNACKYGRGADGAPITVAAALEDGRLVVTVRDPGPGVPAHEAARMFRPFHKSAAEAAATKPGVGLGLALSRRLARALGGELALANPGQPGAEFRLVLERCDAGGA